MIYRIDLQLFILNRINMINLIRNSGISKIVTTPNTASLSKVAPDSTRLKTIPAVSPFFNKFSGQTRNVPYRSFSTSIIPRAEQDPTTSRTGSFFKVFTKEYGRQLLLNAPAFLAYGMLVYLFGDNKAPSEKPSQKPAN